MFVLDRLMSPPEISDEATRFGLRGWFRSCRVTTRQTRSPRVHDAAAAVSFGRDGAEAA